MKTSTFLFKVADLIEEGWCQCDLATDAEGRTVPYMSPFATHFCIMGAALRVMD